MRNIITGLLLASMVLLNGCGSLAARTASIGPSELRYGAYPGTRADLFFLTGNFDERHLHYPAYCWISIICPVAMLYSLPVDFVLDTVMLPADL